MFKSLENYWDWIGNCPIVRLLKTDLRSLHKFAYKNVHKFSINRENKLFTLFINPTQRSCFYQCQRCFGSSECGVNSFFRILKFSNDHTVIKHKDSYKTQAPFNVTIDLKLIRDISYVGGLNSAIFRTKKVVLNFECIFFHIINRQQWLEHLYT